MNWDQIKYFDYREFSAPEDPESGMRMNENLVTWLDSLRKIIDHPIIVHRNGGFSFQGHTDGSLHYRGEAVDFHFHNWALPLREQARIVLSYGKFSGVGVYPEWHSPGFHVDIRTGFQIWVQRNGLYVYLF